MKINPIVFLLIVVVSLSGCTLLGIPQAPGPGVIGPGTKGVVITGFSPDVTTVETGTPIVFTLTVHNKGERKAENVGAQLFGIVSGPEWDVKELIGLPTTLDGVDTARGFEGEAGSAQWEAKPKVSKAVDVDYTVVARVFYRYSTISSSLVRVATTEYLRSIGGRPEQFGLVSSKTTEGPLSVTVKMWAPVVVTGTKTTRVQFEITNTGGGRVFSDVPKAIPAIADLDRVTISTSGPLTCPSSAKLVNNRAVITCDLDITLVGEQGFVEQQFELIINYNYFVDQSATVKVLRAI